eukprot:TRINITY_DN13574_c0_g1_i1.p1 TRINITY_DN13574_c0_g1~~TRINITY_DN13574_c0_g1_i1.p1  ORF type:complete len:118 (+),score=16.90 TRINITY_DN13574_c0_g1_i1:647-1000(+)
MGEPIQTVIQAHLTPLFTRKITRASRDEGGSTKFETRYRLATNCLVEPTQLPLLPHLLPLAVPLGRLWASSLPSLTQGIPPFSSFLCKTIFTLVALFMHRLRLFFLKRCKGAEGGML